jgi:hypothetical protein
LTWTARRLLALYGDFFRSHETRFWINFPGSVAPTESRGCGFRGNLSAQAIAPRALRTENREAKGGLVRILNDTETIHLGRAGGRSIEAVVKTIGIEGRIGGQGVVIARREPRAVLLRGEDDVTRLAVPSPQPNVARLLAPVVAYALVRSVVQRRRKT